MWYAGDFTGLVALLQQEWLRHPAPAETRSRLRAWAPDESQPVAPLNDRLMDRMCTLLADGVRVRR